QDVKAKEETKVASSLLDKKPTPGKVENISKVEGFDATTYTLSNGIKVTVKPTKFKSDEIIVRGLKKGGSNNFGVADVNNVRYATDAVDAMGYGKFNPSDMEKVLAGKTIGADVSISEITNRVTATSTVKDLEDMFQLLYLKLTSPRSDKELFEAYKKKQVMQLQFLAANPQYAFIDTVYTSIYNNNPLAPSPIPKPEHFQGLSMDRILDIYKNQFSTADGYEFYIVGNVDAKTLVPLLETYVASLPKANKAPSYKDNGVRPVAGNQTMKYYKGSDPKSMIIGVVHGDAKYTEDFSLQVQALAEILNIRVIEELREKLSGIYGGGYNASVEKEPYENYSINLYLPCGPENVDKLLAAADEVVTDIRKNGPKPEDLDKVKSQWHEKHRESLEKNGWWASSMESVMFWGREKDHKLKYDEWIDKLTVKDIQKVANQVFAANNYTAILYPEAEKKN
ncbi:MAG: insulinase family protein, partial [Taibaiella sp.]|nr:insulinase family protein [Taibaiella sp.]